MRNTISIDGYRAVIQYDPDIKMFRGEFLDLNGGADFYARDRNDLKREGKNPLQFSSRCAARRVSRRAARFQCTINIRLSPISHARGAAEARSQDKSIDQWITSQMAALAAPKAKQDAR